MKIYFCEKCGISIPLQEVVGGRATARDGKTYCQGCHPGGVSEGGDLKLYFCDNCRVSIPLQDVITNQAPAEGEQMICADCARLDAMGRAERRDRIQKDLKEQDEDRFRLHFCDECNTSIPQSHVITGRAVIHGGRTYCERCRRRATTRRTSPVLVLAILFGLGVVFAGGYVLVTAGDDVFGKRTEPTVDARLEERVRAIEAAISDRVERDRTIEDLLKGLPAIQTDQVELKDILSRNQEQTTELLLQQGALERASAANHEATEQQLAALQERVAALAGLLHELQQARPAEPVAAAPPPDEAAAPEDEPMVPPDAPDPAAVAPEAVPDEVRQYIEKLADSDEGVRFDAAARLGELKHKAAAEPLAAVLAGDRDEFVRRAAARSLGQISAWRSVPALIAGMEDKQLFVALTAHESLTAITGEDFGLTDRLSTSQVKKVVQKARDWWEDHANDRTE